jgi:hypothetical protein
MIAIQDFGFRRWEPGAATVVQMLIEPAVAIGTCRPPPRAAGERHAEALSIICAAGRRSSTDRLP